MILTTEGGLLVQRCIRPYILDFRILYMFQSYILYLLNSLDTQQLMTLLKILLMSHCGQLEDTMRKRPIGCHKDGQDMYPYQG